MCPKEFTSRSVTVRVFIFIFIMTLFSFQDCQQRCSLLSYQLRYLETFEEGKFEEEKRQTILKLKNQTL